MCCKIVKQKAVRCPEEHISAVEYKCISVRMDVSTWCMNVAGNGDTDKINDDTFN